MMRYSSEGMGPLSQGQTIAIIGAGPGGIASALTLQREAERRGFQLNLIVFEGKHFGIHYNQCAGVLSPPLMKILDDEYGITLPQSLIKREIEGYILHSDNETLPLCGKEYGGTSLAVRRVEFDHFLQHCAQQRRIQIIETRVTDLEFRENEVMVFTWGGTFRATAVMGAFGLSRAMTATLSRRTAYRPPRTLETMVTKFYPAGHILKHIPHLLDNCIHVVLPPLPSIEFGALIPKGNHITVIIAGKGLRTDDMNAFLELPSIHKLVPNRPEPEDYFKGRFPVSLASGAFGDRYVTIGDAAGLVRPFKGKGINSAIITGGLAAKTMMEVGISGEALQSFYHKCSDITGDIWYGKLVRLLAYLLSHKFSMDPVVRMAHGHTGLRELLFNCVSGRETYRHIVQHKGNLQLGIRLAVAFLADRLHRIFTP